MPASTINKRIFRGVGLWLPVAAVMWLIFYFSSKTGREIPCLFPYQDIVFHLLVYALLAYFFSRALKHSVPRLIIAELILFALIFCITYGLSDEYHQLFVPGRSCSGFDLFIDGLGGFFGSLFYSLIAVSRRAYL